jgi:hypothetical protein
MNNPPKDPFDNIYFWVRVLKISLIVLVPYGSFGFEAGILVGIILTTLFLSKISLTLLEINEHLNKEGKGKSNKNETSKVPHKREAEGKIIV